MAHILGGLAGLGLSIVNVLLLRSQAKRAISRPPAQAVGIIRAGYGVRLALIILAFVIAARLDPDVLGVMAVTFLVGYGVGMLFLASDFKRKTAPH